MEEEIEAIIDNAIKDLEQELRIPTPTFGILSIVFLVISLLFIPVLLTILPLAISAILAGLGLVCSVRGIIKEESKIMAFMGLILGLIALCFYLGIGFLIFTLGFD